MIRKQLETKEIITPSGIKLSIKKLTYGDNKRIYSNVFGDASVNDKVTIPQAQELVSETVLASITSWDITEEDGTVCPINKEIMEEIFTENDFTFVMNEIKDEESKKKLENSSSSASN